MGSSNGVGLMAVFAVSGSVALVALQLHKRLLSEFMKKVELELGGSIKCRSKKRVRFAEDVIEPSSNNKEYREKHIKSMLTKVNQILGTADSNGYVHKNPDELLEDNMPLNRRALYKGIIEYKTLKGYYSV
ncbi:hypothetical protein NE237_005004 [Protea cynaroides]|uniref:Uncharacterized protein n=1 Tax=Protea cynaroides TaxID=273540 RepID=A0A9Q0QTV7_9MAGN|nr:hypothetical protein NE237_005004 [Protea cynaroides]